MTPIERAARAIAADNGFDWYDSPQTGGTEAFQALCLRNARAALLALATPEAISDEMVLAGCHALYPGNWAEKRKKEMREVIAASIRAGAGEKG